MADRVYWIVENDVNILYEDYSGLKGDQLLEVLYQADKLFDELEGKALVLLDFSNTTANKKFVQEIARIAKKHNVKHEKIASIGVTSIQQILAEIAIEISGTQSKIAFFKNKEEALEFLCSP